MLVSGLALGAGATTTLAAWTDPTRAQADFSASTFVVEANPSAPYSPGGPWATHAETAAELRLAADGITPGSTRYAPLALRTTAGSLGGTALLGGAQVTGDGTGSPQLGPALRYRVVTYEPGTGTCAGPAFGDGARFLVGTSATTVPLTTGQDPQRPLTLPAAGPDAPGPAVHLCLELSLPRGADNALQGKTATARWQITATSETT
ncbi:hypothetical protein ACFQS2_05995 [Brachybacterium sp. GCM10030267]|uniref:hypothetical protein n=1 Tax=Brachybacterium sp. GCM10030267 TaxID=3273381 RepID=UPI003608A342